MNRIENYLTQYRLLRRGDACRMGHVSRRDIKDCEYCNNVGFTNRRGRWKAFIGAFEMATYARGFHDSVLSCGPIIGNTVFYSQERSHHTHDKLARALELYNVRHPSTDMQTFNCLSADVRRDYIERANLTNLDGIFDDLDE